jgi:hypothetical protein
MDDRFKTRFLGVIYLSRIGNTILSATNNTVLCEFIIFKARLTLTAVTGSASQERQFYLHQKGLGTFSWLVPNCVFAPKCHVLFP